MSHGVPKNDEVAAQEALLAMVASRRDDTMVQFQSRTHDENPASDSSGLLTFPEKLMALLNDGQYQDSMRWLPEGDAFCLHPQRFCDTVLEPHFRCLFESFTRKLNRWYV